jgi:hypothetical protein
MDLQRDLAARSEAKRALRKAVRKAQVEAGSRGVDVKTVAGQVWLRDRVKSRVRRMLRGS